MVNGFKHVFYLFFLVFLVSVRDIVELIVVRHLFLLNHFLVLCEETCSSKSHGLKMSLDQPLSGIFGEVFEENCIGRYERLVEKKEREGRFSPI